MPVRKPELKHGCETCEYKDGDFFNDEVDKRMIRCYCKARHVNVDAEAMSKDCDFWRISPNVQRPDKNNENRYGL